MLFPNGTPANDSATVNPLYTATSGEMFQYYTGVVGAEPDAQVVIWNLTTGALGSTTEIELNGWCPGGSGASFKFDGNTYAGGCSGTPTDLLFNASGVLVGFVSDSTTGGPSTIEAAANLTGWTENGGAIGGGSVSAPEVDPASAIAALTLLAGGLAVARGRRLKLARVR